MFSSSDLEEMNRASIMFPYSRPEISKRYLIFDKSGDETKVFFNQERFCVSKNVHEESDENVVIGDGSEMREDTNEINALLCSDDEEDSGGEDDEKSTARSPLKVAELSYGNGRLEEDEVAASVLGQEWFIKDEGSVSILGKRRWRRDEVSETLKLVEAIVPGKRGADPLIVLDEAIKYLSSLKLEIEAERSSHFRNYP